MSRPLAAPRSAFHVPLPDGRVLDLGARTLVMAIVNVTPDSFADGGVRFDPDVAITDALLMEASGADLIDIGGESTRPGAAPLPLEEELRRVEPVLEGLRGRAQVPISIDTYKSAVAERALALGATLINDVSALGLDPAMGAVAARHRAALILMHSRGRSADMYALATYGRVATEVADELEARATVARTAGVRRESIILDPGLGFAKRADHSFEVLADPGPLAALGYPLLYGVSRKSYLKAALGDVPASERVWGTAAAVTAAVLAGAHIVRVHDVAPMVDVVRVADAIRHAPATSPRTA
jgi:dihydropteroate synthase